MKKLAVVSQLLQVLGDGVIELAGFPDENLLHREKVPVLSN